MTPEKAQRLKACIQEIAAILYEETNAKELTSLESIEKTVRQQMLEQVSPLSRPFFIQQVTQTNIGKARKIKSCVGVLKLKSKQAQRIGLKPRSQLASHEQRNVACDFVPTSHTKVQKQR